jgi:mannose-6-phosphate isomerase-like protein (cupin superfamily)
MTKKEASMDGIVKGIEYQAKQNEYFRQVLITGEHTQVVIMSIPAGGEIGLEAHPDNDQVLYLVEGAGKVSLNGKESPFNAGDLVLVKAGVKHNFMTVGKAPMKIITTYSPPHHPAGTVHKTKAEADQSE